MVDCRPEWLQCKFVKSDFHSKIPRRSRLIFSRRTLCILCSPFCNLVLGLVSRIMLNWALTFFIIALIAALFGFGGLAGTAISIAKILLVVFLVILVINLIAGRRGRVV